MIKEVWIDHAQWNDLPWRFEPGTPPIAGAVGLHAAVEYLGKLGMDRVHAHEQALTAQCLDALAPIPGVTIYGPHNAELKGAVVAFNVAGLHPHDGAALLDQRGIAVRAGHHCAQPLMKRLGIAGTLRASFSVYNTAGDIERLAAAVRTLAKRALRRRRATWSIRARVTRSARRASASRRRFMLLPHRRDPADLDVALLGIPYDGGTSYRSGARHGPRHIREQSSMIRPWNPVLQVSPFEKLRVVDYGDVDVVPISIEGTFAAIEREVNTLVAAGVVPLSVGGDHSDHASDPSLARPAARTARPHPLRRAPRHLGRVLRLQVLSWDDVPPGGGGKPDRRPAGHPDRDPRTAVRSRRLRLPPRARSRGDPDRDRQGARHRLGGRTPRPPVWRTRLLLLRHRRRRPGVRARHGHARGGRAHLVRGAVTRARAPRPRPGGGGRGRGLAALRRARSDHEPPRRQPALRAASRSSRSENSARSSVLSYAWKRR